MNRMERQIRSATVEQAAQWFVANRERALSLSERAAFVAWLRESPANVREYLDVAGVAGDLTAATEMSDAGIDHLVTAARADQSDIVELPGTPTAASSSGWRRPLALAAGLGVLLLGVLWILMRAGFPWQGARLTTAHGEQRIIQLADGSVMHMNSDSQVKVRFSPTDRLVEVEHGQALFEVAPQPTRRFHVRAGATEVIALGTRFDVYRRDRDVLVTVMEGKVAVKGAASQSTVQAGAGDQVEVVTRPVKLARADVPKAVAWTQRQIVFDQEPLETVTREFNRYGRVPIEVTDPKLQTLRITGIFNAYDTQSFVEFLRRLDGVAVDSTDRHIVVQRKADSGT